MSDKTGPLTLAEFETLANLLRRAEVHHAGPTADASMGGRKMRVAILRDAFAVVRKVYCDLYVPSTPAPAESEAGRRQQLVERPTQPPVPHYSYSGSAGAYTVWQDTAGEVVSVGTILRTTEADHRQHGVPRGHQWKVDARVQGGELSATGPTLDRAMAEWCRQLRFRNQGRR